MKLLIYILSLAFLVATSGVTFFNISDKNSVSLTEKETSAPAEENKENQDDDIWETELLAYLNNTYCTLPTALKKPSFIYFRKAYLSPYKTYDSPPPEC